MTDSKKVFFDTAPFIYYLENDGDFKVKVKKVIADNEEADFVTSTVTVGEYLTGAFKNEDKSRVSDFRGMISDYDFEVTPISWDIAEKAARKSITGFRAFLVAEPWVLWYNTFGVFCSYLLN